MSYEYLTRMIFTHHVIFNVNDTVISVACRYYFSDAFHSIMLHRILSFVHNTLSLVFFLFVWFSSVFIYFGLTMYFQSADDLHFYWSFQRDI